MTLGFHAVVRNLALVGANAVVSLLDSPSSDALED